MAKQTNDVDRACEAMYKTLMDKYHTFANMQKHPEALEELAEMCERWESEIDTDQDYLYDRVANLVIERDR